MTRADTERKQSRARSERTRPRNPPIASPVPTLVASEKTKEKKSQQTPTAWGIIKAGETNEGILTGSLAKGQCLNDLFHRGEEGPKSHQKGEDADDANGDAVGGDDTLDGAPDSLDEIIEVVGQFIPKNDERPDEGLVVGVVPPVRATNKQQDGFDEKERRQDEKESNQGSLLHPSAGESVHVGAVQKPKIEKREANGHNRAEKDGGVTDKKVHDEGGEENDELVILNEVGVHGHARDGQDLGTPDGSEGQEQRGHEREKRDASGDGVHDGGNGVAVVPEGTKSMQKIAARRWGYAMEIVRSWMLRKKRRRRDLRDEGQGRQTRTEIAGPARYRTGLSRQHSWNSTIAATSLDQCESSHSLNSLYSPFPTDRWRGTARQQATKKAGPCTLKDCKYLRTWAMGERPL